MTNTTSPKRWIPVLWLILSQLASLILLAIPWLMALTVTALAFMMDGGEMWVVYACRFPIIPILFIAISWILHARHKDIAAAILSGVLLLLPIAAFVPFLFIIAPTVQFIQLPIDTPPAF